MRDDIMPTALKNIVLVSDFSNINGGQAKVAIDSAVLLADAGFNVHFFAATGQPDRALDHPNITIKLLGQKDILNEPNRLKAALSGIWNADAATELKAYLSQFDPTDTVVHCHGYAKALSPAIGPLITDGPLPSVYTMHEYFLACPNGGFYDYQRNEVCTKKALGLGCLTTNCDVRHPVHKAWRVARQAITWGPGKIPRRLKDVIYISETQRKAMAPYMSEKTRMHHVPNPIAATDLGTVDFQKNDIFLFIGRLNPEKGGLIFAEAAKIAGVEAVFVGDGDEAGAIRAANPNAVITGWQTPDQVQGWIGKARALVFPSLWYEGQPLVPMEAISRGIPIIAGTWSAAHEVVEEGVNGVLYQNAETGDLADALKKSRDLSPFDPKPYLAEMSHEKHLAALLRVYTRLLG